MAVFVLKLQHLRVHLRKIQVAGNISRWGKNRVIHAVPNSPPRSSSPLRVQNISPARSPARARSSEPHLPRRTWGREAAGPVTACPAGGAAPRRSPPLPGTRMQQAGPGAGGQRGCEPCPARSRRHKPHETEPRNNFSLPAVHPPLYVLRLPFTSLICKRLRSQTALSEIHHMRRGGESPSD